MGANTCLIHFYKRLIILFTMGKEDSSLSLSSRDSSPESSRKSRKRDRKKSKKRRSYRRSSSSSSDSDEASRSRSRERKKKKKKHKYKQKKSKKSKKRIRERSTSESEKSDKESDDFKKDLIEEKASDSKLVPPPDDEHDAESSDLDIKAMLDGIEEEMDLGELMKQKEFLQKKLGLDGVSEDELFGEKEKDGLAQKEEGKPQELIEVHSDAEPEVVEIKSDSDVEHLIDV